MVVRTTTLRLLLSKQHTNQHPAQNFNLGICLAVSCIIKLDGQNKPCPLFQVRYMFLRFNQRTVDLIFAWEFAIQTTIYTQVEILRRASLATYTQVEILRTDLCKQRANQHPAKKCNLCIGHENGFAKKSSYVYVLSVLA